MATLFEYVQQIDEIIMRATDEDGVIDESKLTEELESLELEKSEKVDNCISYYKSRKAMAEALKNEKQAITRRQQIAENEAERMKEYLEVCLKGSKWESVAGKISYRKSVSVEVDENFNDERFISYEPKISKSEIKDAIKNGEVVEGATLIEKNNMQIK